LIVDILDSKNKILFGNALNLDTMVMAKVIRELSDLDNLANVECIAEEMVPFKMNLPLSFVAIHLEKLKPILWSKWNFTRSQSSRICDLSSSN
jgi:hypothetical protein